MSLPERREVELQLVQLINKKKPSAWTYGPKFSYIFLKSQGIKEHTELSWEGVDTMGFGKTETGAMVGAGGVGGQPHRALPPHQRTELSKSMAVTQRLVVMTQTLGLGSTVP